jgi:hypothetical protein
VYLLKITRISVEKSRADFSIPSFSKLSKSRFAVNLPINGKGKGKVVLVLFLKELHAVKAYWGVEA